MRKPAFFVILLLILSVTATQAADKSVRSAHYWLARAGEKQPADISDAWILLDGVERVNGKPYQWWRMVMKKSSGGAIAIKALSERAPMTSKSGIGDVARYLFSPSDGAVLEYIDKTTGRALLPQTQFRATFLPNPAPDADFTNGFASTGTVIGNLATMSKDSDSVPQVDFSNAKKLLMRTDLLIGTGGNIKDDGRIPIPPNWDWHFVPHTQDDVKAMIAAGFNYFGPTDDMLPWMENEPVFIRTTPRMPDGFYRSNFSIGGMFVDEPMVRLGWAGGIPESPTDPSQVAEALRLMVAEAYTIKNRLFGTNGAADIIRPKAPTWETEYWSAWYELQAGAPGIVHEGRYVDRGYGWEPESLLGNGLEKLTKTDMFDFYYAFMRGAARSFDGEWGTSIYNQSQKDLRTPAMIRAYEAGARYLWFWSSDTSHHVPFVEQLRLAKAITEYAEKHPRNRQALVREAEVGIALPPGYAFSWGGIWGMQREQLNPCGISYGDIAAAMAWQGILCSRKGIDYDFLVDHPGIEKLGYKRIIRIKEDGTLQVTPAWNESRAPKNLRIEAVRKPAKLYTNQKSAEPQYQITRAGKVNIDGDFSDWSNASWISMGGDKWYGDSFEFTTTLNISEPVNQHGNTPFLGLTYAQLEKELMDKYCLEALPNEAHMGVTSVEPGSPADKAGLREGDMILYLGDVRIRYPMDFDFRRAEYLAAQGKDVQVKVRRSGMARYGGGPDLSARVAFMVDDYNLYFAAEVNDDVHIQNKPGNDLWMHDSVQFGLDPILQKMADGYPENGHEIGFGLRDGVAVVNRWNGRRGQPVGEMSNKNTRIIRKDGKTIYESAIPLSELAPFAPDTWSKCGIDIVVNDNDEENVRKGRLELAFGAMTHGKKPKDFAVFECEPSANTKKVSGGLVWDKRCMQVGGSAELSLVVSSPKTEKAIVRAELISLDTPNTKPAIKEIKVPTGPEPVQYTLKIGSDSPAGRYRLNVSVRTESGWKVAEDKLNVYIYP